MNIKIEIGQKIKLKHFEAIKIRAENYDTINGYVSDDNVEEIMIDGFTSDTIIGTNGKLYPLKPDEGHGYSDFFSIII